MNTIVTQCPFCKQMFNVAAQWNGQNTQCPSCGKMFVIQQVNPGAQQQFQQGQQYQQFSASSVQRKSTASLVLGIINCIFWIIPIIGVPLGIIGLVLGCLKKYQAGIILNAITLVAAVINSIVGAILGAQGKLF